MKPPQILAGIVFVIMASACSSGSSSTGASAGSGIAWSCSYSQTTVLQHDWCTCLESDTGTPGPTCNEAAVGQIQNRTGATSFQCCYASEDALTDGTWRPRCECVTPDLIEHQDDGNDAALNCEELRTDPKYAEDDQYTRNFRMVDSCPF